MISPVKSAAAPRSPRADGRALGRAHDLPFRVVGVGLGAEAHGEAVGLLAVDGERHGLRRLAERDRQDAGRQRIERAGVAGLLRVEQPLHRRRPPASTSCRAACRARPSRGPGCPSCAVSWLLRISSPRPGGPSRSPAAGRCGSPPRRSRRAEADVGRELEVHRLRDLAADVAAVAVQRLETTAVSLPPSGIT